MGSTFKKVTFLLVLAFFSASSASATPENDRVYQLDSIGWLKPVDNVDGIFTEYLNERFAEYFKAQSRFVVRPLRGLKEIFGSSSASYDELIREPGILRKISQKFRVECVLRSRVFKEGDSYRFELDWVYAPKGDVIAQAEFRHIDDRREEGLRAGGLDAAVKKSLDELIAKLPFLGQVTGVDADLITISVGHDMGLRPGQFVTLHSIESVKRHPVLGTIEEWRWQPVGRARVEQVDASLAFARVIETSPGAGVVRNQKIRQILDAPVEPVATVKKSEVFEPKMGWVAANLGIGTYSREIGVPADANGGRGGGGLQGTFEIDSQIWINSRFIGQGNLGASVLGYSPTLLNTDAAQSASYSGNRMAGRFAVGYAVIPMETLHDPIAWVHAGYRFDTTSLTTALSDFVATSSTKSLFIGVGGEFPISASFMAQIGMDLGVIRSAESAALSTSFGEASSTSDLAIKVAGAYQLNERIFFRTVISLQSQGIRFANDQTLNQKLFSITPSIMYYF